MAGYSQFNGTIPVSPVSSGIWRIERKRRPTDPDPEKRKRDQGGKDEKRDKDILSVDESNKEMAGEGAEEEAEEDLDSQGTNRASRKVDLII